MKTEDIPLNRLYNDLSYLWPVISPPEEYGEEAGLWQKVLREYLGAGRHEILELGVGGGHNLSHLTAHYDAAAVDISGKMLGLSRRLNPSVTHHLGDMRNVRLGRKFKAVLIHDAISHMLSEKDILDTFTTAAVHIDTPGVLIVAPDYFRETFSSPTVECRTQIDESMKLTYFEYAHDPDPNDTVIETVFTYLIHEKGSLRLEHDRMITGLFSKRTWACLMSEAGFSTEERTFSLESEDRPYVMLIGRL